MDPRTSGEERESACESVAELGTVSYRRRWHRATGLLVGGTLLAAALQLWAAADIVGRATALRDALADSYGAAIRLERRLGYGGLIHNFKNYVLRPDEDGYRVAALADADEARRVLEALRRQAASVGIEADLDSTLEMIASYAARLEDVRTLSASEHDRSLVDERVRFDDAPALAEVQGLLAALEEATGARLDALERDGMLAASLGTGGTAALGILFVGFVARRQRRHVEAVGELADRLALGNASLTRANDSLGRFAGIVSHDLKGPLRNIHLYGEWIVDDIDDRDAVRRHVAGVLALVRRMDTIIESLLDFTRTGFEVPNLVAIDAAALFAGLERELREETRSCGARLTWEATLDEPLTGDPDLLSRVLTNLVCNSLKYAREGEPPLVHLAAEARGEWIELSVADHGIGIDPRHARKIFEPLQRLHGSQDVYEGVGIGLALGKAIVEAHGGSIRLDTDYADGTRIVFSLPRAGAATRRDADASSA